jgi:hypothetical protein
MPNFAALSVRIDTSDIRYHHMIATACLVNTDAMRPEFGCPKGEVDYPWSHDENFGWMDGFRVNSQINSDERKSGFYGMDCEYRDVYSIGIRKAESMAKWLKKIDKSLEKQQAELGYCRTCAEYIWRVAKACGCKFIVFKNDTERFQRTGWAYNQVSVDGNGLETLRRMEAEYLNANKVSA